MTDCPWYHYEEGGADITPLFGYEGCILTAGEWYEDPWSAEHWYYEFYNDLDFVCFYGSTENYETCYAFFRTENNVWEFAPGY